MSPHIALYRSVTSTCWTLVTEHLQHFLIRGWQTFPCSDRYSPDCGSYFMAAGFLALSPPNWSPAYGDWLLSRSGKAELSPVLYRPKIHIALLLSCLIPCLSALAQGAADSARLALLTVAPRPVALGSAGSTQLRSKGRNPVWTHCHPSTPMPQLVAFAVVIGELCIALFLACAVTS